MTAAAERKRKSRARRRLGLRPVKVDISQQTIDWLVRSYDIEPTPEAISLALSAFVSDAVMELGPT
jgi:hypothetical protein